VTAGEGKGSDGKELFGADKINVWTGQRVRPPVVGSGGKGRDIRDGIRDTS